MSNELVRFEPPQLPDNWTYEESVVKIQQVIYKWKNVTWELASELWVAREILRDVRSPVNGTIVPLKTWASYCQEIGSSKRVVNRWLSRWFSVEPALIEPVYLPPPKGTHQVIVIDPPWPYGTVYDAESRRVASPYPEMGLDELGGLEIPYADDCVLWLWTTNAFMHDAYHLLEVWEFEPKAILTWFKERTGVGHWLRGQTEHCILSIKGEPQITHSAQGTALIAKATTHSTKPDEFYALVESLCPGNKLDMFARKEREGWNVWGNEIPTIKN